MNVWQAVGCGIVAAILTAALMGVPVAVHALRQDRRINHLAAQLRARGGRDTWDVPCAGCGRPMRDADSITITRADGDGAQTRVFHHGRAGCEQAAGEYETAA